MVLEGIFTKPWIDEIYTCMETCAISVFYTLRNGASHHVMLTMNKNMMKPEFRNYAKKYYGWLNGYSQEHGYYIQVDWDEIDSIQLPTSYQLSKKRRPMKPKPEIQIDPKTACIDGIRYNPSKDCSPYDEGTIDLFIDAETPIDAFYISPYIARYLAYKRSLGDKFTIDTSKLD